MPVNPLSKHLNEVEAAFIKLFSGYIERYEEECLTPERVNLRIRVRFPKGYMLEWNEAIIGKEYRLDSLARTCLVYLYTNESGIKTLLIAISNTLYQLNFTQL